MMERAIEALKANEGAALKAFNDEKNKEFRDRDLRHQSARYQGNARSTRRQAGLWRQLFQDVGRSFRRRLDMRRVVAASMIVDL